MLATLTGSGLPDRPPDTQSERLAITRDSWRDVGTKTAIPIAEVEEICSAPQEHRRRGTATVLALALISVPRRAGRKERVDYARAALLALGLVSLLFSVLQGQKWGWTSAPTIGHFLGAAASLYGFVALKTRRSPARRRRPAGPQAATRDELRLAGRRVLLAFLLTGRHVLRADPA